MKVAPRKAGFILSALALLCSSGISAQQIAPTAVQQLDGARQRMAVSEAKLYLSGIQLAVAVLADDESSPLRGTFPCTDNRFESWLITQPKKLPKACWIRIEDAETYTIAAEFENGAAFLVTSEGTWQVRPEQLPDLQPSAAKSSPAT